MEDYENQFWSDFEKFNSLNCKGWRWETPKANKEHTDEFGIKIKEQEIYFKKATGPGFHNAVRLSRVSMEKLINIVMTSSPVLENICQRLHNQEIADKENSMKEALQKLEDRV